MRKIGFTAFIGWAVSAALLIAGCVPPPSPPDPNLSKMLDPQKQELVNMRAEYKKAKEDLTQARADLDSKLKSLCRGEAPLELIDAGHNRDFRNKIKAVFARYPHTDPKYGPPPLARPLPI
jgi:outer membrane murein-binding lipoprotein Lpp